MSRVAHYNDARLATLFSDRCGTAQRPERRIIAATEGPGAFAEQRREVDPADTGQASRPAGSHRQPLSEPYVSLATHTAPIRQTYRSYQSASARRGPRNS